MVDTKLGKLLKNKEVKKLLSEGDDPKSIKISFARHLKYSLIKDEYSATALDKLFSLAYAVRDRLVEKWIKTQQRYYETEDVKRVYYLSLEFLIGRLLLNT